MTPRDRFLDTLNFRKPGDRLPMVEWAAWWGDTTDRWKKEGFPKDLDFDASLAYFGLDNLTCIGACTQGPGCPQPAAHGAGIITDEKSYEAVRKYLFADASIDGLVDSARKLKERHDRGELIIRLWLDGFFWSPRGLFGIERHLFAFYDQPGLMHRINDELADFNIRALDALFRVLKPDMVGFAEDMSYNNGPMLSREQFDEFLAPYYRRVIPHIRKQGVRVLVDTDGDVTDMIPWMMAAGIEGVYPLERQAGVDVNWIRRQYPEFLLLGAYDKMVMSKTEKEMRAEFERLLPAMKAGGFIPSVDHQTPPGVSFENYKIYIRLFREYCEKAAR